MTLPPELRDFAAVDALTNAMWPPHTVALIARAGLMGAMGNRETSLALPFWAERARRGHANAVENLGLFAPAVLLVSSFTRGSTTVIVAAHAYLFARVVHWFVYVAGIPVVRTLAFATGWVATVFILYEPLR